MHHIKVTPKDFFLWAGAMISLYVSVFSFLTLFFEYIDRAYPDSLDSYVDPYSGAIRFAIASLVVLFPTFLILMRFIRRDIAAVPEKRDLWVRRWALFFTVFVAGATVIIDLITLINSFLGGDITTRFVLKVVIVLLVASAGFMHFLADIWGYWDANQQKAKMIGYAAGATVLISIVGGFFVIGSPMQIREYRFDDQKVSDLTNIQYQIVNYWQTKQSLPASLSDLNDPISGYTVPLDPQSGASYVYKRYSPLDFGLCATFNAVSQNPDLAALTQPQAPGVVSGGDTDTAIATWDHDSGEYCFDRSIDPSRYPPFSKNSAN